MADLRSTAVESLIDKSITKWVQIVKFYIVSNYDSMYRSIVVSSDYAKRIQSSFMNSNLFIEIWLLIWLDT